MRTGDEIEREICSSIPNDIACQAMLDVVKRLREMAAHDEDDSDDSYGVILLRTAADALEAEILAAGQDSAGVGR